jgi:para-nitrobenzyl esterase
MTHSRICRSTSNHGTISVQPAEVATVSGAPPESGLTAKHRETPFCCRPLSLVPLVALLLIAGGACAQDFLDAGREIVVATSYGPVAGIQHERVQVFRAIPYAAAPTGRLRFKPAMQPQSWLKVRSARVRGAACPQILDVDDPAEDGDGVMSEDCLTLNIWTPRADSRPRPVMVFIHGGAFEVGSAADSWYDGEALAERGDVIVVTIQYRLGAFGFLELDELGVKGFEDSGNLGLLDQVAALNWVRRNIAHFGGDPHNVTLFGESAGGASIHGLLSMRSARDLFHKAIIESGDPGQFVTKARAKEIARDFMSLAHVTSAAAVQSLSMEEILRAQQALLDKGYGLATFSMVADGRTFERTPIESISADPSLSKPLLIGTNSDEIRYWIVLDALPLDRQPDSVLTDRLVRVFGPAAADVLEVYARESPSHEEALRNVISDVVFRMPAVRLAEINGVRQPTYMYLFTYRSLTRGPTGLEYGAMHELELPFVFHLNTSQGYSFVGPKGSWSHLSDQMVEAWTRFARAGDPNNPLLPHWPRYDTERRATMELGQRCVVMLDPYGAERRAWDGVPSARFDDGEAVRLADPPAETTP